MYWTVVGCFSHTLSRHLVYAVNVYTDIETDRLTYREKDSQIDIYRGRQTDRQTDRQMDYIVESGTWNPLVSVSIEMLVKKVLSVIIARCHSTLWSFAQCNHPE